MAYFKNLSKSKSEYTRLYSLFKGVDLGLDEATAPDRLAYAENVYRDYSGDGDAIESVPGFRKLLSKEGRVHSLFFQRTFNNGSFLLAHIGKNLYRTPFFSQCQFTDPGEPIAELGEEKCNGFAYTNAFYILTGEAIVRIGENGEISKLGNGLNPYIPTVYQNGQRYEERNLLVDKVYEEFTLGDPTRYAHGTRELLYRITDGNLRLCSVAGIDENYTGELYIPSIARIGDVEYSVEEIDDRAFYNNKKITSVVIAEGVKKIGRLAFTDASGIVKFITPDSLKSIGYGALSGCVNMTELHIGAGIEECGENAFTQCYALEKITYPLDEETYRSIKNLTTAVEVASGVKYTKIRAEFPLKSGAKEYSSFTVDGVEKEFTLLKNNGKVYAFFADFDNKRDLINKTLKIIGDLDAYTSSFSGITDKNEEMVNGIRAISECRIAAIFDQRVFLTGNKSLPNTVFYSARDNTGNNNPLYFPVTNYFNDGVGHFGVTSLLPIRDTLAVFKMGDDGTGSIFYHVPKETGNDLVPKIYPVSYVHSGICALGRSLSFMDDPVFLCPLGLCGLDKSEIDLQRSVVCRSHNVNYSLLGENLNEAHLGMWQGYLALCCGGNVYLADSRSTFIHSTGAREYEWFLLKNIGTYKNSTRVYRYSSFAQDDYELNPREGEICETTVYSDIIGGEALFFSLEDGRKYALDATEEFSGGDFYPASCYLCEDDFLVFGTECGDVCVFNNDMRGHAPERIRLDESFSVEQYREEMGRLIHPDYYSFDDHAARYCIKTSFDNCGIPHLTKDTVKRSATVKCRSFSGAVIGIEVGTNSSGYSEVVKFPGSEMNFADLDFSLFTTDSGSSYTLPFGEKEKNWVEKQIAIYSDRFRSPLGIYSIAYRYTVKGRIKRN